PFFFHNGPGGLATREHLCKNFFALFSADFSGINERNKFVERGRWNRATGDRLTGISERALQVVENPVCNCFRFLRTMRCRLEISREIKIIRQHSGVVSSNFVVLDDTFPSLLSSC